MHSKFVGEVIAGFFDALDHLAEHLNSDHDVPDQLTAIGIAEFAAAGNLMDLPEIMKEGTEDQQFGVDAFVARSDQRTQLHHVDGVLNQPAGVGVMVVDRRGRGSQLGEE